MKKIFTLLMCLVMALGIVTTVYAEEMTGSITIENAIERQSYYIYRIFNLESFNAEENAYSYTVNETWSDFAHDDAIRGHYITLEEKSGATYVKWIEGANVNEFANLAIEWAKEKNISNDDGFTAINAGSYTFDNLKLGYYLVDSSVGAICSLDTTNPNVTVREKNTLTTVEKKVEENSTQDFGKENDASIGDTVKFKSEISVGKGAENLVLHDKMDETLSFNNDVVVRIGSETVSEDNYTVSTETADGCTFEVKFNDKFSVSLNENTKLLVEYSAVLGSNAKIHNADAESNESANRNETWVSFGDDLTSTHSVTNTWTYEFDLVKTNQDNKIIKGATFYLYN
ncbi:MAG: isopeptide-forming domain-containing fimbrial protein, partial [Frisingicoccus sp.]|uniref:isopeptide-forming domain-containing fimbrial protein n=1 Tax=Frisingicoccus sp. TaxID=1918627 RepID=UPI00261E88E3